MWGKWEIKFYRVFLASVNIKDNYATFLALDKFTKPAMFVLPIQIALLNWAILYSQISFGRMQEHWQKIINLDISRTFLWLSFYLPEANRSSQRLWQIPKEGLWNLTASMASQSQWFLCMDGQCFMLLCLYPMSWKKCTCTSGDMGSPGYLYLRRDCSHIYASQSGAVISSERGLQKLDAPSKLIHWDRHMKLLMLANNQDHNDLLKQNLKWTEI